MYCSASVVLLCSPPSNDIDTYTSILVMTGTYSCGYYMFQVITCQIFHKIGDRHCKLPSLYRKRHGGGVVLDTYHFCNN